MIVWAAAYFPHNVELETAIRANYAATLAELDQQIQSLDGPGYPGVSAEQHEKDRQQLMQQRRDLENRISNRVSSAQMEQSFLGQAGKLLEPIVKPLGWDWRIGCAVVASFPAREVVIGVMGVIYDLGEGQDEDSATLRDKLQSVHWPDSDRRVFTVPVALSIMVFFALCAQCGATLVVIRRETNSWRWPLFTFAYMTTLAYVGALLTYHISSWLIRI